MTYNVLWSSRDYGGAEIYVRKMKNLYDIDYIALDNLSIIGTIFLFFTLLNPKNTFIFHDVKASLLSIFRFFYFKDYFVVHGPGKRNNLLQKLFLIFSLYAKKVILVSDSIYLKIPSEKFRILENSSSLEVKCNYNSYDFVYFGRIEESKGVGKLCKKWSNLDNRTKLHIIGDGSILKTLKKRYENENSVIFHGAKTHEEIGCIIKECGFYVSCSPREGMSLSLLEAMSADLIPIVTDIASQNYIKSNINISLLDVDSDNANEIFTNNLKLTLIEKNLHHNNIKNHVRQNEGTSWEDFWKAIL